MIGYKNWFKFNAFPDLREMKKPFPYISGQGKINVDPDL